VYTQAQAACIALPTSVSFGSLDVLGFQQGRDQRLLSRSEESDEEIAGRTDEMAKLRSECQDRVRRRKSKVLKFGLVGLSAASLRSAAKWKKYEEIWDQLAPPA
jgi:hypothetical protein